MSLLFNMLSRLIIAFLQRSECLLISWLQSPFAVILEPPKIKSNTVSTVSVSICHEVMGPDAMIFVFWMLSFKPTFSLSSYFHLYMYTQIHLLSSFSSHVCNDCCAIIGLKKKKMALTYPGSKHTVKCVTWEICPYHFAFETRPREPMV